MQKVRGRSTRNLPQNPVKECSKKKKKDGKTIENSPGYAVISIDSAFLI